MKNFEQIIKEEIINFLKEDLADVRHILSQDPAAMDVTQLVRYVLLDEDDLVRNYIYEHLTNQNRKKELDQIKSLSPVYDYIKAMLKNEWEISHIYEANEQSRKGQIIIDLNKEVKARGYDRYKILSISPSRVGFEIFQGQNNKMKRTNKGSSPTSEENLLQTVQHYVQRILGM